MPRKAATVTKETVNGSQLDFSHVPEALRERTEIIMNHPEATKGRVAIGQIVENMAYHAGINARNAERLASALDRNVLTRDESKTVRQRAQKSLHLAFSFLTEDALITKAVNMGLSFNADGGKEHLIDVIIESVSDGLRAENMEIPSSA